ncbi:MAG: hypothetical protein ACJ786_01495 [Catenulispora sp.]
MTRAVGGTRIGYSENAQLSGQPGGDVPALLRLGEQALHVEGSLVAGRRWFDAAYRVARVQERPEEMALAALGLGGLWVHERRAAADAAEVEMRQRDALRGLDPRSPVALRLRARLAGEADYRGGGHSAVLAVVDEARSADDPLALAEALSIAHHCLLGPEHTSRRLDLADELLRVGSLTGRRGDVLMGLLWRTIDLFLAADPQAERSLAELDAALADQDHLAIGFAAAACHVMLGIRDGRFDEAEALAADCAGRGAAAGDADVQGWYGAQLVAIRWFQGRSGELVPTLAELVHSPALSAVDNAYFAALAAAAATLGDRRQAACALGRLSGRGLFNLVHSSSWLVAMYGVVEAAHLLDDAPTSAQAYSLLLPFAEQPMVGSLAVACFGSTHHALGVASMTVGEPDRAVGHLQAAVRANEALGHWPAAVLSRHRLGQARSRRARSGDGPLAAAELTAAAAEAARLGLALPRVGAVATTPSRVGTPPRARSTDPLFCRRRGRTWEVQHGYRTAVVGDSVGMKHLHTLIAHEGQEIPAIDLAQGALPAGTPNPARAAGSRQPQLDEVAVRDYRRRLAQLQEQIDEYEAMNDLEHATRARTERDWLITELQAAAGLSGRVRHFTDDAERARIAVTKAIHRALDQLVAADPAIGAELRSRVQTGRRCCFHLE